MRLLHVTYIAAVLLSLCPAWSQDSLPAEPGRVLFIYDTADKNSSFFVDEIRRQLHQKGLLVDEAAGVGLKRTDPSPYERIVIYGMVMAFNFKSLVRDWVKSQKSLENKKIHVFVTANRWFKKNLHKDLVTLTQKRRATVVDAVSMATNKTTESQKREWITSFVSKLDK